VIEVAEVIDVEPDLVGEELPLRILPPGRTVAEIEVVPVCGRISI
jgi:hypothetical protein